MASRLSSSSLSGRVQRRSRYELGKLFLNVIGFRNNVRYWPKVDMEVDGSWRLSVRLLNFYYDERSGD